MFLFVIPYLRAPKYGIRRSKVRNQEGQSTEPTATCLSATVEQNNAKINLCLIVESSTSSRGGKEMVQLALPPKF